MDLLSIRCKKCNGKLKEGFAIVPTLVGYPDFPDGEFVTMSYGGGGKMISCMKCEICGWSIPK
jgi:hypothetical protein